MSPTYTQSYLFIVFIEPNFKTPWRKQMPNWLKIEFGSRKGRRRWNQSENKNYVHFDKEKLIKLAFICAMKYDEIILSLVQSSGLSQYSIHRWFIWNKSFSFCFFNLQSLNIFTLNLKFSQVFLYIQLIIFFYSTFNSITFTGKLYSLR